MIFFVVLARSLNVSEFGLFRYLLTLASIYGLLFSGVPIALTKLLGSSKADQKLRIELLSGSVFILVILYLVLGVAIILSTSNQLFLLMFVFALMIDALYIGFARGILDYLKLAGFKLVENFIQLVILLSIVIGYGRVDFTFSVVLYSFSGLVSLAIFEIIRPDLRIAWRRSRQKLNELLRYAIGVTFGSVGWTLFYGINSIYIERFYGTEQVGYFSIGITLMQVFSFLPDAIFTILMPKIAGMDDKRRIRTPLRIAALSCLFTSVLIAIPLLLFRDFIIRSVFSEKYLPAAVVVLPLIISQVFVVLHQAYGAAWQGLGKPVVPSTTITIAAVINIVTGYFLTKNYGIGGAATSLAISAVAAWIMMTLVWNRWVRRGGLEMASVGKKEI